jgi:ATP-dependent RNA helicase DeaD
MTEHMHYTLASQGFNSAAIHGGKTQIARMSMLERFRNGNLDILVATDVAARGLDINNIQHVINFDFPTEIEVHLKNERIRGK